MQIQVTDDELITLISDLVKYVDDCEHVGTDPCCSYCHGRLIVEHRENVEIVDDEGNKVEFGEITGSEGTDIQYGGTK